MNVLTLLGLLTLSLQADAQPHWHSLEHEIGEITKRPATGNAWWGIYVVDLGTGQPVYDENAGRSFMPASGTKLYTTAAALEQLGPDYQYRTQLFADGTVADSVLYGSLIVRGAGDPTLGSTQLDAPFAHVFLAWADSLRAAGITHITGDIVGDDDIFDDTPLGDSWAWDDEVYGYAAQISGLSFHDNAIDIAIKAAAAGSAATVSWEPLATSYVTILNDTRTVRADAALEEGYRRLPGTNTVHLYSEVPEGQTDRESIAVHNPTGFFVHVLHEVLVSQGIDIGGRGVDVDDLLDKPDYDTLQRLASYTSPPLSAIVRVINKESQNLYAELLLRTIGRKHPMMDEDLAESSAEMGLAAAMETYAAAAIDTSRLQLVDGSGLSRKNLVTPAMTVGLLQYMANHADPRIRTAFENSLAVGGQDGTLQHRFRSSAGMIRAKTGSLGSVSSLSGYLRTRTGRRLAFSFVCNHYTVPASEVRRAMDHIAATLISGL